MYAYLAICVAMIVFNCACIVQFKRKDRASQTRNDKLKRFVRSEVRDIDLGVEVSKKHIRFMKKACKRVGNLASMDEELDKLSEKHGDAVDEYIRQILPVFIYLSNVNASKDKVQQAHFAYIVEKYHVVRNNPIPDICDLMMSMVHSPNLYCRENALRVIYDTGSEEMVLQALLAVCNEGYFHHEKLIVDGLMRFTGDKKKLMDLFVRNLNEFDVTFQVYLLNHIRFSGARYDDLFFRLLTENGVDDEIRFCAMRYFGRNIYESAYETLYHYADNPELQRWEYAAIAATSLASYPRPETIEVLKKCLSNYNWYIRKNAAESLERLNLSYFELADIFDGNDRYAREILQYRMDLKKYKDAVKEGKVC